MKLISWNVNGIRATVKNGLLEFMKKEEADFFCFQETKASKDQLPQFSDYQIYASQAEKKGYSGVAIYTNHKPISVKEGINTKEHDNEGRVITLEYENFFLVNCYTPNSGRGLPRLDYRKTWDKLFLKYLKSLNKPIILCGDLNVAHTEIDLANPKSNYNKTAGYTQVEIDGFNILLQAGYIDTFRIFTKETGNYTYWGMWNNLRQRNVGWRIDYFLISKNIKSKVKSSKIMPEVLGSDHCPISMEINL